MWLLLTLGFILFACDEFFMFHEQFTDALEDREILTNVPRLHPGDIGVLIYMAVGWLMLYVFWQILRSRPASVVLFVCGLVIMTLVAISDAFVIEAIGPSHKVAYQMRVILEEIGESVTQLCFALAFLTILFDRLHALCDHPLPSVPG